MNTQRTLPCGCSLDGRFLCELHRPQSLALALAEEACALVCVSLFVATAAVWALILFQ